MRLKQIKLSGFKSFVDSTSVPFPQQMTAVVGPNGCGKSNVIDAVRWVLGESSAKNLRGDAMTDVIFNGSAQRKPVSQASVELVFENTEGRIAGALADRSEISIRRVVTRDAQSNYFLNGTKCRRRDITDIFLGTGLGPRSYAIIEQGMISRLIESKPQELRVFIEEAAGISKYKERRRETETRIKHTRENLDRLADVREELGKNIDKLKRQATAALRYKELKAQERKLKAELTTIKWLHYSNLLSAVEKQMQQQQLELDKFQSQELGDQRVLLELKQQAQEGREALDKIQSRFYQLGATISRLEQQILHQRQQQQTLSAQLNQVTQSLNQANDFLVTEQEQEQSITLQLELDEPQLLIVSDMLEELSQELMLLEDKQQMQQQAFLAWQNELFSFKQKQQEQQLQLQMQKQQYQQISEQVSQIKQNINELSLAPLEDKTVLLQQQLNDALENDKRNLKDLEQSSTRYQELLLQAQELDKQVSHFNGELKLIEREKQNLLTLLSQQGAKQEQLLKQLQIQTGWASAVALVLGQLKHAEHATTYPHEPSSVVLANKQQAQAGSLAEVVLSGVYPESFNHIFVAKDAEDAKSKLASLAPWQSVICQSGYWLGSNWSLLGGAELQESYLHKQERLVNLEAEFSELQQKSAVLLSQKQLLHVQQNEQLAQKEHYFTLYTQSQKQVQQLQTDLLLAEQERVQAQKLAQKLEIEHDQALLKQAQLEESMDSLAIELEQTTEMRLVHEQKQHQLQSQTGNAQQQLVQLKAQFEQKRVQQQQLLMQQKVSQQQLHAITQNIVRAKAQQQQLQEQVNQLTEKLMADDEPEVLLQEQLQESLLSREACEQELQHASERVSLLDVKIKELEQGQQGIVQVLNQKRAQLESLRIDGEGYKIRANNMLELLQEQQVSMKDILPTLDATADEALWQQQLDKTVDAVSRLGPINLAAIEEYEQQAERKQYLDAQNEDLTLAMATLETAIRKIDKETRQKFKETFEQVNEGLKNLFPKVFGGGSAYLELTDEDLLETGVTIMARPPGKKNSTIHLLSGGEKALTALSLVFSIFRLNPAPFCMLDEVDAPLDDANVGRFCNLVREMSETVQFIYISHNKIAMEMAAQLMGVTMQEPGVSRVVAVDVDDAVKMAAAS